jgi:hypothetical protein
MHACKYASNSAHSGSSQKHNRTHRHTHTHTHTHTVCYLAHTYTYACIKQRTLWINFSDLSNGKEETYSKFSLFANTREKRRSAFHFDNNVPQWRTLFDYVKPTDVKRRDFVFEHKHMIGLKRAKYPSISIHNSNSFISREAAGPPPSQPAAASIRSCTMNYPKGPVWRPPSQIRRDSDGVDESKGNDVTVDMRTPSPANLRGRDRDLASLRALTQSPQHAHVNAHKSRTHHSATTVSSSGLPSPSLSPSRSVVSSPAIAATARLRNSASPSPSRSVASPAHTDATGMARRRSNKQWQATDPRDLSQSLSPHSTKLPSPACSTQAASHTSKNSSSIKRALRAECESKSPGRRCHSTLGLYADLNTSADLRDLHAANWTLKGLPSVRRSNSAMGFCMNASNN